MPTATSCAVGSHPRAARARRSLPVYAVREDDPEHAVLIIPLCDVVRGYQPRRATPHTLCPEFVTTTAALGTEDATQIHTTSNSNLKRTALCKLGEGCRLLHARLQNAQRCVPQSPPSPTLPAATARSSPAHRVFEAGDGPALIPVSLPNSRAVVGVVPAECCYATAIDRRAWSMFAARTPRHQVGEAGGTAAMAGSAKLPLGVATAAADAAPDSPTAAPAQGRGGFVNVDASSDSDSFGLERSYAHGPNADEVGTDRTRRPPSLCAHFTVKRCCIYGSACRFVHPLELPAAVEAALAAQQVVTKTGAAGDTPSVVGSKKNKKAADKKDTVSSVPSSPPSAAAPDAARPSAGLRELAARHPTEHPSKVRSPPTTPPGDDATAHPRTVTTTPSAPQLHHSSSTLGPSHHQHPPTLPLTVFPAVTEADHNGETVAVRSGITGFICNTEPIGVLIGGWSSNAIVPAPAAPWLPGASLGDLSWSANGDRLAASTTSNAWHPAQQPPCTSAVLHHRGTDYHRRAPIDCRRGSVALLAPEDGGDGATPNICIAASSSSFAATAEPQAKRRPCGRNPYAAVPRSSHSRSGCDDEFDASQLHT